MDLRGITGNFLGAACVFSKKLRNWKQKNKSKMPSNGNAGGGTGDCGKNLSENRRKSADCNSDFPRRRSCDTEPRFSIDAGQTTFDEPRASWDGYMIARSIPRLAPMFSAVENGILGSINRFENHRLSVDGPMNSIVEDESSSGVSGLCSGHSNSDSSSVKGSSFDRSSSVKNLGKKVRNSDEKVVSPANVKLVITERELNSWPSSTDRDDGMKEFGLLSRNSLGFNPPKSAVGWHKVCNALGFKHNKAVHKQEMEVCGGLNEVVDGKLTRSRSVVGPKHSRETVGSNFSRKSVDGYKFKGMEEFMRGIDKSTAPASKDVDSGIMPFYMSPLRSVRSTKSGNPQFVTPNVFHLN